MSPPGAEKPMGFLVMAGTLVPDLEAVIVVERDRPELVDWRRGA
jgi:hypothetical protein